MKKVYAICSGEYSDWRIDHMFESEEKRDKVLEKLNSGIGDYYSSTDYDLDDDNFNLGKCEDFSYVECEYSIYDNAEDFKFKIINTNTFADNKDEIEKEGSGYSEWEDEKQLFFNRIITDKNYKEYIIEEKYLKVCRDYMAKAKYMSEVEGLTGYEISEQLFK